MLWLVNNHTLEKERHYAYSVHTLLLLVSVPLLATPSGLTWIPDTDTQRVTFGIWIPTPTSTLTA